MESTSPAARTYYQADGAVDWGRVPRFALISLAAALVGAWLLNYLLNLGFYMTLLVPGIIAALVGCVVWWQCGAIHCRNGKVAAGIGFLCGLVFYLGYFQAGLMEHLPLEEAWRVDLLPKYIHLRMLSDTTRDRRGRGEVERPASPVKNYLFFVGELLLCAAIPTVMGLMRAERPYSSAFGCWLKRETRLLEMGHVEALERALLAGNLHEYLAGVPTTVNTDKACAVHLDYVNEPNVSPLSQPAYLSVEDKADRKDQKLVIHETLLGKPLELAPQELQSIASFFPKLNARLDLEHAQLKTVVPVDVDSTR